MHFYNAYATNYGSSVAIPTLSVEYSVVTTSDIGDRYERTDGYVIYAKHSDAKFVSDTLASFNDKKPAYYPATARCRFMSLLTDEDTISAIRAQGDYYNERVIFTAQDIPETTYTDILNTKVPGTNTTIQCHVLGASSISSNSVGIPIPNPILKITPGRTRGTILCETDLKRASVYKAMVQHEVLQGVFASIDEIWKEAHFSSDPLQPQDPAPVPIRFNTPVVKPTNEALNHPLKSPRDYYLTHSKRSRNSYGSQSRLPKKQSKQARRNAETYHRRDDRTRNSSSHISCTLSGMSLSSSSSNESERRTSQKPLFRTRYGNFSSNFNPPSDDRNHSDSVTSEKRGSRWEPRVRLPNPNTTSNANTRLHPLHKNKQASDVKRDSKTSPKTNEDQKHPTLKL